MIVNEVFKEFPSWFGCIIRSPYHYNTPGSNQFFGNHQLNFNSPTNLQKAFQQELIFEGIYSILFDCKNKKEDRVLGNLNQYNG